MDVLSTLLPLVIYVALSLMLRGWLMDDAGISFAYSRNIAWGHGLVSQPGMPPVEGYSNTLWVLLMVPFFWLGIFDPFVTAKAVSALLVGLCFYQMIGIARLATHSRLPGIVAATLLAGSAPFVIWTSSGLENPLMAFLTTQLLLLLFQATDADERASRTAIVCGLVAVGLALTRPEGILYSGVFPVVLMLTTSFRGIKGRSAITALFYYGATVLVGIGGFLMFRLLYFGDLYPNTYHVKGGPTLNSLVEVFSMQAGYLDKFRALSASVLGNYLWALLPVGGVLWIGALTRRPEVWKRQVTLLSVTGVAWLAYMLMPLDWMGEYRLATPLLVSTYLTGTICIAVSLQRLRNRKTGAWIAASAIIVGIVGSAALHYPRLKAWQAQPAVSFAGIAERFGNRYNRWADHLGISEASLLVPDIGGTLYYSKLRIYDLAGLTDRTIALNRPNHEPFDGDIWVFYDYVFDTIRPTFIHTHGSFTMRSQFDKDVRFARDYVPITEYEDTYAGPRLKRKIMSGDYVRREVAEAHPTGFKDLVDGTVR